MIIETSMIEDFYRNYNADVKNKEIEKNILNKGLYNACLNKKLVGELSDKFNLELAQSVFHNQHNSYQCNIYAGIRVIKSNIADNLNIDFNKLNISANYISFFDKLEKANEAYRQIAELESSSFDEAVNIINNCICQGGTFNSFTKIIKKYGIVPEEFMRDVDYNYNPNIMFELLKDKLKGDTLKILEAKQNKEDVQIIIKKLVSEVYIYLSKVIGNPPLVFSYEYYDKSNDHQIIKNIKPIEFLNRYLTLDLDKFITVSSFNITDLRNVRGFIHNPYMKNNEKIINLSLDKIKQSIINQLKNNMPVWFSCETSKTKNEEVGIISDNIYNFSEFLDVEKLNKNELITLDMIDYDHAMTIIGVNVEEGNLITRFKVEDSLENDRGFYIMTDSFFDNYVLTIILYEGFIER